MTTKDEIAKAKLQMVNEAIAQVRNMGTQKRPKLATEENEDKGFDARPKR